MRDSLAIPGARRSVEEDAKARSLHALGAFYLRQGFPRQGLSLLLVARDYGMRTEALDRAIAQAYLLSGAPKKALEILDFLDDGPGGRRFRDGIHLLRSRALLALGRVEEARAVFAMTAAPGEAGP